MTAVAIVALVTGLLAAAWQVLYRRSRFHRLPVVPRGPERCAHGGVETVYFAACDGTRLEGWLFRPAGDDPVPLVIMAPGLGGTKEGLLEPFAWRFAAAGMATLLFDYRCFGGSEGLPRHWVDPVRHAEDYKAALAFARGTLAPSGRIDAARLALWGSSFSGGTAIRVAAEDAQVAALVAQCPYLDTPPHLQPRGWAMARFIVMVMLDMLRPIPPVYIPLFGRPGEWVFAPSRENPSVHDFPGALGDAFWRALPSPPRGGWENRMLARGLATLDAAVPAHAIPQLRCPTLLVAARDDDMVPLAFVEAAHAALPGEKQLCIFDAGHFGLYRAPVWRANADAQAQFLARHLTEVSLAEPRPNAAAS